MASCFFLVLRTRNCLGVQIKEDEMSGGVARVEEKKTANGVSVGEREGKNIWKT